MEVLINVIDIVSVILEKINLIKIFELTAIRMSIFYLL